MRKAVRWIAVLAVLGIIAAACGGNEEPTPAGASASQVQRGGTLRIGDTSEPNSAAFDPSKEYFQVSFEIFKCCLGRG
jgi:hypothetical protein